MKTFFTKHDIQSSLIDATKKLFERNVILLYKLLFTLGIFFAFTTSNGTYAKAQSKVDSLKIALTKDLTDSMKVATYVELAFEYLFEDIEITKSYVDSAFAIANMTKQPYSMGTALKGYGLYHRGKGQTKEAIRYYEEALDAYPFREDSIHLKNCFFNLGVLHYDLGDFKKATNYIMIDLQLGLKNDMKVDVCDSYNTLGNIFGGLTNYQKAEEYLLQSYQCASEIKDTSTMAFAAGNLQSNSLRWKKYDKSLEYGEIALELETALQNPSGIGFINYLIGYTFADQGQYEKALEKGLISLPLLESYFPETYGNANQLVGRSLLNLNRHQEGLHYLKKAEVIANSGDFLELQGLVATDLSLLYEKINREDLALFYARKRQVFSDSMFIKEKVAEVNRIETLYNSAQKDIEIKDQQLTIQNQKNAKQQLIGGMSLLSIFGIGMFLFQNQRSRKNKIIAQREADLKSQRISQLEKEKQILSMSSMIEGQEAERTRIARDLHDGLGGLLSTIKVKFGVIQKEIAALESMNVYQQTSTMIDDACTEVRKIAHNMMPDSLSKLGLIESVRDIADYTSDLNIKVINLGMHAMTETQQIMLYRVIQEFLNNARKHANADQVIFQFSTDDLNSNIYLEDDGDGFDLSDTINQGLGLKSMESRINYIGGTHEFDSTIGVGTTLLIKIPK